MPADPTYDDFVRVSAEIMKGRNTQQQQAVVRDVLMSLLPPGAPEQFRCGGEEAGVGRVHGAGARNAAKGAGGR